MLILVNYYFASFRNRNIKQNWCVLNYALLQVLAIQSQFYSTFKKIQYRTMHLIDQFLFLD